MAAKPQNGSPSKHQLQYDVVKFDGRLKEVVFLEKLTRKQWEKKWGFTADLMKMYYEDVEAAGIKLEKKPSRSWEFSKVEMKVLPSPPVPDLSSGFVGWRSSKQEYSLEIVGPLYISPRFTIDPPDLQPQKQMHVFVG